MHSLKKVALTKNLWNQCYFNENLDLDVFIVLVSGQVKGGRVGPLFFFSIQIWPQTGEYSTAAPLPSSVTQKTLSDSSFIINGWEFPIFKHIFGLTSHVQSHMVTGTF